MDSLGSTLFSELSQKFFGILVSVNARVYLGVIDALEREIPARGDSLDRSEALEIIDRVLALGLTYAEEDEEVDDADVGHPASMILRRLIDAKWLEEERRSDYRRTVAWKSPLVFRKYRCRKFRFSPWQGQQGRKKVGTISNQP